MKRQTANLHGMIHQWLLRTANAIIEAYFATGTGVPRLQGPYTAGTDAWDAQTGWVLLQEQSDAHEKGIW